MRIGILTFHCAHNYGAVLQCYALQETLKETGHEVQIIDYRPNYLTKPYRIWNINRIKSKNSLQKIKNIIIEVLALPKRILKASFFLKFQSVYLNLTNPHYLDFNNFDIIIIGSDQIWDKKITKGFDPIFWGDLGIRKERIKYISYAASMEFTQFTDDDKSFITQHLKNFDHISVREDSLSKIIQPFTESHIYNVLDPTLIANKQIWENFIETRKIKKDYILIYQIRENENTKKIASHLARQINTNVVFISAYTIWNYKSNLYDHLSPQEFVNLIYYSKCIVTTSFHGSAFSIIFNKSFYYVKLNDNNDSRSIALLKALGLDDRIIECTQRPDFSMIKYENVNKRLKLMQNNSIQYLSQSLIFQ